MLGFFRLFLMFNCGVCGEKPFNTKALLAQHCKGKGHLLNIETARYSNDSNITSDETHHTVQRSDLVSSGSRAFSCPVCPGASFDTEAALKRHCKGKTHLRITTGNDSILPRTLSFSCSACTGAFFETKDGLRQHCQGKKHLDNVAGQHSESGTQALTFNCPNCLGASFETQAGLTQHCKGQRHLVNVGSSMKRKESEAAVTAAEQEALGQRQKLSEDAAASIEAMDAASLARIEQNKMKEAAYLTKYRDSLSETRASALSAPVCGGFAEEVKPRTFHESSFKITRRVYFSGSLGAFKNDRKRY